MAEQKLDVIVKASDLMEHSIRATSNKKRYPAKYRMLINRIQNTSMDIYENLFDANRLNVRENRTERSLLQSKVISGCDKLSCFIEMSMKLNLIDSDYVEHWQGLVSDVKYMTIGWKKKDQTR